MTLVNAFGEIALETTQTAVKTAAQSIDTKIPAQVGGKLPVDTNLQQPVTDTQLRATPVPVTLSGSSTVELGATSLAALETINVGGTVELGSTSLAALESITATGPLTDAQLRASAVSVSLSSSPLPTGAATETTLSAISTKLPTSLGAKVSASSLSVVVASDQTLPISASSLPLPSGAATSALQTTGNTSLATIAANTPALGQALSSASSPVVLPAAQITALTPPSTVTVTQATGTNLHAVIDSGNVTATVVGGNVTAVKTDGSAVTQPISASALPLPTGAATETTVASMSGKLPSSLGSKVSASSLSVVMASDQTVPVSATSLPLPTGAATSALQTTGNTSLATIAANTPALGQALSSASSPVVLPAAQITALTPPTTVTVTQATGTNLHAVIDSGVITANVQGGNSTAVKVDGSAVTQPISATSLPLPTSAATSALQTTGNASLATIAANTPALGQALAASSSPVVLPETQITALTPPTTVTVTQATGTNLHAVIDSGVVTANIEGGNTLAVKVDGSATTQPISASTLPLPTGAATEATQQDVKTSTEQLATLQAGISAVQEEIKNLTDTMVYLLSAVVEKMPRVTGNDQAAVTIEGGSVGIINNQDFRNITGTVATVTNTNQVGTKYVSGDNLNASGLQYIYNNIIVS